MDEAVLRFRQWRHSAQVILISTLFNEIGIDTIISIFLCCLAWFELYSVNYLLIRILISFYLELMSFIKIYLYIYIYLFICKFTRLFIFFLHFCMWHWWIWFKYFCVLQKEKKRKKNYDAFNNWEMLLECNLEVCKSCLVLRIEFNDALKAI